MSRPQISVKLRARRFVDPKTGHEKPANSEKNATADGNTWVRKIWRDNGLSITVFSIFILTLIGQILTGIRVYNEDRMAHHLGEISWIAYLGSGHFVEAIFENWESEFLQMGAYIVLTASLYQRGSAESNDPDKVSLDDRPTSTQYLKKSKLGRILYENSLSLALLGLFAASFVLHILGGCQLYNEEQLVHGESPVTVLGFLATSTFWFQSFQNWQSEFFSIGVIVILSIWLRQKGSSQSKSVDAPNSQTGD